MGLHKDLTFPKADDDATEPVRLATDAWQLVARLFISQQSRRDEVASQLGLHTSDLISLFHMRPGGGVSQRDLAEHWACDPSWVTNRIDRLEQLGLVERRLSPTDRRVKEVWLTAEGEQRRDAGIAGFGQPPEAFAALSITDLRQLTKVLAKLDVPDPTLVGSQA